MKGEGGEHNEGPSPDAKEKPPKAWGCFEGGIGGAPVPCGESQEEQGGGERVGPPNQQVGKRNGKVYEKEKNKKRDPGGAMENPSGDPRVTGSMRDAENECGRQEKPRGEGEGRLGKE